MDESAIANAVRDCIESMERLLIAIEGGESDAPAEYFPSELRRMLDVSPYTLNAYAKQAEVPTPKRGDNSHRYSQAEVVQILQCMASNASQAIAEVARKNLELIEKARQPSRANREPALID